MAPLANKSTIRAGRLFWLPNEIYNKEYNLQFVNFERSNVVTISQFIISSGFSAILCQRKVGNFHFHWEEKDTPIKLSEHEQSRILEHSQARVELDTGISKILEKNWEAGKMQKVFQQISPLYMLSSAFWSSSKQTPKQNWVSTHLRWGNRKEQVSHRITKKNGFLFKSVEGMEVSVLPWTIRTGSDKHRTFSEHQFDLPRVLKRSEKKLYFAVWKQIRAESGSAENQTLPKNQFRASVMLKSILVCFYFCIFFFFFFCWIFCSVSFW